MFTRNSDREKFQMLTFRIHLKKVGEIYSVFERQNLSPVLIKGLAAAVNYPKPFQRIFSDIDLAVEPRNFERAGEIIRENNFNVDLHKGLRHLDTADWKSLCQNSRIESLEGTGFRTLSAEDHLRVLCIHWLNDGGADRTRLWDIYFLLWKNSENFCWEKFFAPVDEKRIGWLKTVLLLAEEYFGALQMRNKFEGFSLPKWIKNEVENEWRSDVRLIPLERSLGDKRELVRQIGKRIPPNALQAIVETDSRIYKDTFFLIRAKDFLKRAGNSLKSILKPDES